MNTNETVDLNVPAHLTQYSLEVSDAAAKRIMELQAMEKNLNLMLRITVLGGGCSGFQYAMEFDDKIEKDDLSFERNGVKVVTDDVSMGYLSGSVIDFSSDMMGSSFVIKNPNAKSACGCGNSFTPKD